MKASLTFFFSLLLLAAHHASATIAACEEASCQAEGSFPVRFPFRLRPEQRPFCGMFDLSCDDWNQTVISLTRSGSFLVKRIDYDQQAVYINDQDECLPKRFLNGEFANFSSDSFQADAFKSFTFMDCPSDSMEAQYGPFRPIECLGGGDHAVVAVPTSLVALAGCTELGVASVPVSAAWQLDLRGDVRLRWRDPDCRECTARGGFCGYRRGSRRGEVGCSVGSTTGLPRSAKYGVILGVGIPGLLCLIGLASYVCSRVRACGRRRRQPHAPPEVSEMVVVVKGLDAPTIASFPKAEVGESRRLPNPSDSVCPICLADYQPKETIRTIPECNHYFHADCVDEWLRMNATCPLCRNSPETSSASSSSSSLLSP